MRQIFPAHGKSRIVPSFRSGAGVSRFPLGKDPFEPQTRDTIMSTSIRHKAKRPGLKLLATMFSAAGISAALVGAALPPAVLAQSDQGAAASAARPDPKYDLAALKDKALRTGQVLVIVELRGHGPAFQPEGLLRGPAEVAAQHSAIIAARDELLDTLRGHKAEAYRRWDSVPQVALKVDAEALQRLIDSPLVKSIQEDGLSAPSLDSASAFIGFDLTWLGGLGGTGQTVVILDTGIDADHPFFGNRVKAEACFSNGSGGGDTLCPNGTNSQTGPGSADALTANCVSGTVQLCDHGTHVAGIAAGRGGTWKPYNGVSPDANIIAIQVFTRLNSDSDCGGHPGDAPCVRTYDSDQISAMDYVNSTLRNTWNISSVNMSLGGGEHVNPCDGDSRKASVDTLRSHGIATAIAAGNDGWTNTIGAPGCISSAVTVGSVTDTDNPPADSVVHNMSNVVDLLAVGAGVDSSIPDDAEGKGWWGTSMATPQVTGAFALLRGIKPSLTVDEIETLLKDTGKPVTDTRMANNPDPDNKITGWVKPRLQLAVAAGRLLSADVAVSKDCKPDLDTYVLAGEIAKCFITVRNNGPDPALGVQLVDTHVSNGSFQITQVVKPSGISCTETTPDKVVTCDLGSLVANQSVQIEVDLKALETMDIDDQAVATTLSQDPVKGNNDNTNAAAHDGVHVKGLADLQLTKVASAAEVVAGTDLTYTLTAKNLGPSKAVNTVVTDVLPAGITVKSVSAAGGSCNPGEPGNPAAPATCTFDGLAVGAQGVMTVVVTVNPDTQGTLLNNGQVRAYSLDDNNANDLASASVAVISKADLAVTKTDTPDPVIAGQQLTYDIQVVNNGPSVARSVQLNDPLPTGLSFTGYSLLAGSGSCAMVGTTLSCTLGNLAPGANARVVVTGTVSASVPDGTDLSNTATASSSAIDEVPGNNSASAITRVQARADLAITKDALVDISNPAPRVVYTVTLTNKGSSDAQGVTIKDELPLDPKKIVYLLDTGNGACAYTKAIHDIDCTVGTLPSGGTWSVKFYVDVKGVTGDITNKVSVASTTVDPVTANNTAYKTVRIKSGTRR